MLKKYDKNRDDEIIRSRIEKEQRRQSMVEEQKISHQRARESAQERERQ
ncbi:hypothetical protein CSUB01_01110 [Colletotrichum sublineola]|uniref:Uncharacterized protein n=1 Tax=Colletotrichum sublineola TaxID=1173701 RepID=A0A066WVP4_COLSU|nr:hypothetical protein CSUB01_01110 [Colletotrichum sublineola]